MHRVVRFACGLACASALQMPFTRMPRTASRGESPRMIASLFDLMGGGEPSMVAPENALPGRDKKMMINDRHRVLGTKMDDVPEGHKVAVFANGCFWGSEKGIWRLPGDGIYSTAVGYCAGFTPNPTYEEACSGRTGHTEGVRVVYDPAKISFVDILRWFWEAHDPTSGMRQGNDVGTQYRSGFYYFDEEQKELIEASKAAYEKALGRPITTEIAAAADYDKYGGLWFYAEAYHQQVRPRPTLPVFTSRHPRLADGSAIAAARSTSRRRARGPTARRSRRASPCRPSSRGRLRSCSRSTRPSCPRPSGSSTRRSAAAASCSRPTRRSSSTWRSVFRGRVPGLRAEGLGS